MTKILYIIDNLGCGGAQKQLFELLRRMPKEKYEVEVVSLSIEKLYYENAFRNQGIKLTLIPQSGKWDGRALLQLRRYIKRRAPDMVHTWLFTSDLYGRLAAWTAGVPIIISAMRNTLDDMPWHYRWTYKILTAFTSAITVNAEIIRQQLIKEMRIPKDEIHTIYNGIDLMQFPILQPHGKFREEWGIPSQAPRVAMVARMSPQKDHRTFLKAAKLVLEAIPETYFILAGDGPLKKTYQRLSRTLNIQDRVVFAGEREDMPEFVSPMDVLVLATHFEGCSNVIMEAMAGAKPVVATDAGGNAELIQENETGFLVPAVNPELMAEKIIFLLNHPEDAAAMGLRGRQRMEEHFSLDATLKKNQTLYEGLMKEQENSFTKKVKADFDRAYAACGYQGKGRKFFHTLTSAGFQAVLGYRICHWLMKRHIPLLGAMLQRFVEVGTGISIPAETSIGPGLLIYHFGGIIINGDAVIGENCTLHHGVTIGNKNPGGPSPKIGNRVLFGAGCKVLGDMTVGDDAVIGANAVVIYSIPEGAVAVGIPARIVSERHCEEDPSVIPAKAGIH